MSGDSSTSSQFVRRRSSQLESQENEFEAPQSSAALLPPPRSPLSSIPDPSQYQKEELDSDFKQKLEAARARRLSEKRAEVSDRAWGSRYWTPNVPSRGGKAHAESMSASAQSTPARTGPRVSLGGPRGSSCNGGRGLSFSSRDSRGIHTANAEFSVECPHFELEEDSSFWEDNSVQVLVRVRPLSNLETVSQGHGRCLKQESPQTLLWLGHPESRFTFDHVACETIAQEKLFRVAGLPMVENCLSGYNSCVFAYGQTGSGKTYTMMGEINEVEGMLNEDCGITARIFEYLFARIRADEERRRDEKLMYSCKCSFLEIYNEQITDLLEPSSTNLQLREDMKKGVYVENLTEYNVRTVRDVVKLLLQGAANRKIAATHMNGESSRSHSVFTCIIESSWEKDSMNHFRFARLNLVDLAGSERQKSSGAEGDRLKEAANINKSLSTLGLVIMTLVDLAHGKQRHVPYRDSRLTFLLQDSLGGNSKTMIIANVSPSICSANETLSTLKFAQRAKLIQNNAKVNEDASGDVNALQRQIQQLKGQLSFLMEHHNPSRTLVEGDQAFEASSLTDLPEEYYSSGERPSSYSRKQHSKGNKKSVKLSAANLASSLRRERNKDVELETLKAEIKHLNILASKKEEDAQRSSSVLKLREEKIQRLEMLVNGELSSEKYLVEENKALIEEIQLLQERIDSNPESARLSLENNRLSQELQLYQTFYGQGERERLVAEISDLRNQLLEVLEGNATIYRDMATQDLKDLQECQKMNFQLIREVDELRIELQKTLHFSQSASDSVGDLFPKDYGEFRKADKRSSLEVISIRSDMEDEIASYIQADDNSVRNRVSQSYSNSSDMQHSQIEREMMEAKDFIEAMEAEQFRLIKELQHTQEENDRLKAILEKKDCVERQSLHEPGNESLKLVAMVKKSAGIMEASQDRERKATENRLHRILSELEEVTSLKNQYEQEHKSQLSRQEQVELVCEQVEMETARTILQLQEEVATLQLELREKLTVTDNENRRLREAIATQQEEMRSLCADWENATLELTNFLLDGSRSLKDVSRHISSICGSFPQANACVSEFVEKAAITCIEKEETILLLQRSLEAAQNTILEMEQKISSLKGATIALSEFQHLTDEESTRERLDLNMQLQENKNIIKILEDRTAEAEKRVYVAFLVIRWLSDNHGVAQRNIIEGDTERVSPSTLVYSSEQSRQRVARMRASADDLSVEQSAQVKMSSLGAFCPEKAVDGCYGGKDILISALQLDARNEVDACGSFVGDMKGEASDTSIKLSGNHGAVDSFPWRGGNFVKIEDGSHLLRQIKDELRETNRKLNAIKNCIDVKFVCGHMDEDLIDPYEWSGSCSTSGSDSDSIDRECEFSSSKDACSSISVSAKQLKDSEPQSQSCSLSDNSKMELNEPLRSPLCTDATGSLTKELADAFNLFNKQYVRLAAFLDKVDKGASVVSKDINSVVVKSHQMLKAEAWSDIRMEESADEKFRNANSFLMRLEENSTTIREANLMLNELMKANENAKCLTSTWKQTGEALMVEKTTLLEDVEYLKSSLNLKEEEDVLLRDTFNHAFIEIEDSLSSLEVCFKQIQRDVNEIFKAVHADVLSLRQDTVDIFCNSKTSVEDLYSEILAKSFNMFVLYQCHVEHVISKFHSSGSAGLQSFRREGRHQEAKGQKGPTIAGEEGLKDRDQSESLRKFFAGKAYLSHDDPTCKNTALVNELERKDVLLKGLLFDFRLLQESACSTKMKLDETEKLLHSLNTVKKELDTKSYQLDEMMVQYREVEGRLAGTERQLKMSVSDLEQAKAAMDILSNQNVELRTLLKDLCQKKSQIEEQLDEQKEVVKGLEEEILHLNSMDRKVLSSVESKENELKLVSSERDQLLEEVRSLNNKLQLAYALADENEAIAVEARQVSEASKIYAEQKEEEVKILENSIEELEHTINMLEKKVYEMDQDVERHRQVRDALEQELQALRERMSTCENFRDSFNSEIPDNARYGDRLPWIASGISSEVNEAHKQIKLLEEERAEQEREIERYKEYISELVLHAEAQAAQYQQKYKTLEMMVHEVKADQSNQTLIGSPSDKKEKCSTRTRGSSSPFRCISSIVHQMNTEKDQELSAAKKRLQEQEALAASQQKEVCMLKTRLAAAENMTHDVIRDLLGVKLDLTSYANFMEQHQVQQLLEAAFEQKKDLREKEKEVEKLRKRIEGLIEERESCIMEVNRKEADVLAAEISLEQLQQRDQMLAAQNEMLKVDKSNLMKRVTELDEMVKALLGTQNARKPFQHRSSESSSSRVGMSDLSKRLAQSDRLLNRASDELAPFRRPGSTYPHDRTDGNGSRRLSSTSKDLH